MTEAVATQLPVEAPSLIQRMAKRYAVDANKLLSTLKSTAFKQQPDKAGRVIEPTNEEMMALLIIADRYRLDPFCREIYAFRDYRRGGIVAIVGVDGWSRLINEHPAFNGCEFTYGHGADDKLEFVECTLYRKDREHAAKVREYLRENKRDTENWSAMPTRMLRHRAFIQAGRLTFGYTGLHDEDEGRAIIEGTYRQSVDAPVGGTIANINAAVEPVPAPDEPSGPSYQQIMDAMKDAFIAHDIDNLDAIRDMANGLGDLQQIAEVDVEYRRLRKLLVK
jgi:hypothetical protein